MILKVKDLIEELKKFDEDAKIEISMYSTSYGAWIHGTIEDISGSNTIYIDCEQY